MNKMRTILKLLLFIVIGGMIAKGGSMLLQHRELTHKENRGVSAFNNKNEEEAIAVFKEILRETPDHETSRQRRVGRHLARIYKDRADDPGKPLSESIELYRKANELDESIIENETIKKLLESDYFSN